jgi:hypothetical protein
MGTSRNTGKRELNRIKFYNAWALFLCFLKLINALSIATVYSIYYSYPPNTVSPTLDFLFYLSTRTFLWLSDFFTMITLVYIIYIQSR